MGDALPSSPPPESPAPRRRRADAERNRSALLDAARAALADTGSPFSLEAVAREAGVGIGTLYRHFPTKEALVSAAYEVQVAELLDRVGSLLDALPADQALRAWLSELAAFLTTKRGMLDALRLGSLDHSSTEDVAVMRERLADAVAPVLAAGARDGSLRTDVPAGDVVVLAAGVLMPVHDGPAQAERLLDLVLEALRPA